MRETPHGEGDWAAPLCHPLPLSALAVLVVCVLLGCGVHHSERDAPGLGDVRRPPPPDLPVGAALPPEDPGERVATLLGGPVICGGVVGLGEGSQAALQLGLEASLHVGEREHSHYGDAFFIAPTEASWGGLLGVTLALDLDPAEATRVP